MNTTIKHTLIFILGASTGSVLTWKLLENRFEQRYQEEVRSTKEAFSRKGEASKASEPEETKEHIDSFTPIDVVARKEMTNYHQISRVYSATEETIDTKNTKKGESKVNNKIRIIRPEELGDNPEYSVESFTYHSDGVLTDDRDEVVMDWEDIIGPDALTSFGEYEDDSVFVRNDRLKADYEILMDQRSYADILREKPYLKN